MKNLIIAALAVSAFASPTYAEKAKVGKPAPDFTLEDSKGTSRSLKDFAGKTVMLEWYNRDCPYVNKHYGSGNMPALQKKYTKKGVVWLSIISSAKGKQGHVTGEQADALMKKDKAAPSYVLFDADGKVGKTYGAKTTPHMYVIDGKGVLRYNGAIDSVPSADPADIKGAEPWAADALDAVLAGKEPAKGSTRPYGCSVKY